MNLAVGGLFVNYRNLTSLVNWIEGTEVEEVLFELLSQEVIEVIERNTKTMIVYWKTSFQND